MIKDSERRVAAVLLDQAGCHHAGGAVTMHLSQADLGEMVNLSRHPVGAILADLADRGWVACGYRTIGILDGDALRRLANGG
ncbi:Crp/Fnr family transcriptional regulator [Pseudoxanthomonas daejeonensis]|nr:helix-turn-helix domain-containing protein [Pseudoxanthomonas daejeonensis]